MNNQQQGLQAQIDAKRSEIHSDQYSISVGELASMYRDGELDIHPEFQRYYRWSDEQKSKFIESMLLGIPIPSIFVAQRDDGKWDVIDGLQRLATIFQLMGILKDEKGVSVAHLELTGTRYLPALEGMRWQTLDHARELTSAQQLFIKRAKLDVKIVLRESDATAKFELFQRLNTGGSELSAQEIRNAMMVAINQRFYDWIKELAGCQSFVDCVVLTERAIVEQFDRELVLRFLVLRKTGEAELKKVGDLGDFLTDQMMELIQRFEGIENTETEAFVKTFDLLSTSLGADAFRKYDTARKKFTGGFSISAYEVVALGVGYNADALTAAFDFRTAAARVWSDPIFVSSSGSGVRASTRIPITVMLGRSQFKP